MNSKWNEDAITDEILLPINYGFLFKNNPDAVFVLNLNGNVLYANKAACNLTGYSFEELHNHQFENLLSSKERVTFHYYFKKGIERFKRCNLP